MARSFSEQRTSATNFFCEHSPMAGKLHIATQGCQMNEYDSARMRDLLRESHGLELTDSPEEADVLLLNTCSVREKAQEKVFSELGRWRQYKQLRPHVVIGVGGCVASQEGDALRTRVPFVDIVFGPQTLHRLPQMLDERMRDERKVDGLRGPALVDVSFPEIEKFDALPPPSVDGPSAFVSIMEGCSKYCSFCVVPYTRGAEISRPLDAVLREVEHLARNGVREITFLGQNVNAYRGALSAGALAADDGGHATDCADLAELLALASDVPGIGRLRFTTSHPLEFGNSLIDAYAALPKLVSHLHLPVQSGSDRVLAAMKRGYTALEYKAKVRRLRRLRPALSLSSDFIVGFPGEDEADFAATLQLIADLHFDASFSFLYSRRPGTPAASLHDDTPLAVHKSRLLLLQTRIRQQADQISAAMVGGVERVLVDGHAQREPGQLRGRVENNRVVNFASVDAGLISKFVRVRIDRAMTNTLLGSFVEVDEQGDG